jgi:hypothetical protein
MPARRADGCRMSMTNSRLSRRSRRAAAGAVAAIALGGAIAGCGSADTTGSATAAAASANPGATAGAQNAPPAMGKAVTGAAAEKAKAAALAKYPGTVERVLQLDDGSYVVHVIRSSGGEVHVKVSNAFAVTGLDQGGPGGGGAPPPAPATSQS